MDMSPLYAWVDIVVVLLVTRSQKKANLSLAHTTRFEASEMPRLTLT